MKELKKNIIFITNLHLWSIDNGKGGKAFFRTVDGYIEAGWNVILITTGGGVPDSIRNRLELVENEFPVLDKWVESGNKVLSIIGRFTKLYRQRQFYIREAQKIIERVPTTRYVIYAYEVEGVGAAEMIANRYRMPMVTRFQGTVLASIPDTFLNRIKRAPHFEALKTKADLVIMTNDGTQGLATMRRLGNTTKSIKFWRNGVDNLLASKEFADSLKSKLKIKEEFVFITVSRLVNWKRVHLAIEGFSKVLKTHSNCKLIIVGDGSEMDRLQQLALNLGISDKILFLGAIEQKLVSHYLNIADVFLSFYDLSNLGNPIMEAMMVGMPIITIDVGDTRELIINNYNGILISNDDLTTIPQRMIDLIDQPDLANQIAEGAKATSLLEFWSWENRIAAEIDAVETLIKVD